MPAVYVVAAEAKQLSHVVKGDWKGPAAYIHINMSFVQLLFTDKFTLSNVP